MATKRVEFVKKVQSLLRETDMNDVQVRYGYLDYSTKDENGHAPFVDSEVDVNDKPHTIECVLVKYDANPDSYSVIQSIEADGLFYILSDILKAVRKL